MVVVVELLRSASVVEAEELNRHSLVLRERRPLPLPSESMWSPEEYLLTPTVDSRASSEAK